MGILSYYLPLGIYISWIIVSLLTIFVKTELGLVYLVLFLPLTSILQKLHIFPFGKDLLNVLVISLIAGWFIRGGGKKGPIFESKALYLPILLYMVITYASLWWGSFNLKIDLPIDFSNYRLQDWKNMMIAPIIYFVTVNNVKNKKWLKLVLLASLVSIFLTDCLFYREFSWYKSYHYTHSMRVSGPFFYLGPNELGAYMAQYGVFIFGLLLFSERFLEKLLLGIVLGVNFYCLMFSFSRAAYLAFPIGIFFVLLLCKKKMLVVFFILLFLSSLILPAAVVERIQMTTLSEEEKIEERMEEEKADINSSERELMFDPSSQGRFNIWDKALEMFKANPLFGTGLRTFSYIYRIDTHNNFLKVLAEMGLIGFSIYIFLYYLAFKSGWQLYRKSNDRYLKGLGLGFSACVISNIIVNLTHDNWTYINLMGFYWILWGLVIRGKLIVEKESLGK